MSKSNSLFEKVFQLSENQTTVRTEILAGFTTFVTLAYIMLVNPLILKDAGMPVQATFAATCIASAVATLIMSLYANYPIAVAPGMGLNAFFTYSICIGMKLPWETALGAVFISGIIFFILTVTKVREWIINGVPQVLRSSIGVGVGLFIAFIGLKNAGIIIANKSTLVGLGNMADPGVLVTLAGLLISAFLMSRHVKGGLLIGIITTTILAMIVGVADAPKHLSNIVALTNPFASVAPVAFHLDIKAALEVGLVSIIFSLTIVDLFDNIGTLIGVSAKANMLDEEGRLPRIGKALFADSIGTMFGALMGTSTVTSYIESAAGVSEGGRTGLTSLTIAILFILSLIFAPLVLLIPGQATAPALIIVGVLMMESIKNIKFDDFTEAFPAFLTIILMPLTYSIAQGLAFGFMSYTLVKMLAGRHSENNAVTYVVTIMFILHFVVPYIK